MYANENTVPENQDPRILLYIKPRKINPRKLVHIWLYISHNYGEYAIYSLTCIHSTLRYNTECAQLVQSNL